MSKTEFVVVFAYDVTRDAARARIAEKLSRKAVRVQKSVFEARLTLARAQSLLAELQRAADPGDSIRMYVLTADGLAKSRASGGAPLPERTELWLF